MPESVLGGHVEWFIARTMPSAKWQQAKLQGKLPCVVLTPVANHGKWKLLIPILYSKNQYLVVQESEQKPILVSPDSLWGFTREWGYQKSWLRPWQKFWKHNTLADTRGICCSKIMHNSIRSTCTEMTWSNDLINHYDQQTEDCFLRWSWFFHPHCQEAQSKMGS